MPGTERDALSEANGRRNQSTSATRNNLFQQEVVGGEGADIGNGQASPSVDNISFTTLADGELKKERLVHRGEDNGGPAGPGRGQACPPGASGEGAASPSVVGDNLSYTTTAGGEPDASPSASLGQTCQAQGAYGEEEVNRPQPPNTRSKGGRPTESELNYEHSHSRQSVRQAAHWILTKYCVGICWTPHRTTDDI